MTCKSLLTLGLLQVVHKPVKLRTCNKSMVFLALLETVFAQTDNSQKKQDHFCISPTNRVAEFVFSKENSVRVNRDNDHSMKAWTHLIWCINKIIIHTLNICLQS